MQVWHWAYFTQGSRWFRAHTADLIFSQIDLWKGCVAVIPPEYDEAIVTQEFPLYQVNTDRLEPLYLAILLRSGYFQRAFRAITTGHSNRRRIQSPDFEDLPIFLPDLATQRAIASVVDRGRDRVSLSERHLSTILESVDEVVVGLKDPAGLLEA